MNRQNFALASALASIIVISSNGKLAAAEPLEHGLSENCAKAAESEDSLVTSVPRILCEQGRATKEVFDHILGTADIFTESRGGHRPNRQPPSHSQPEQNQSTEPKRRVKTKSRKMHHYAGDHFVGAQKANSHVRHHRISHERNSPLTKRLTFDDFFGSRPAAKLTPSERMLLIQRYEELLAKSETWCVLNTIQHGEGGGLLTVVGGLRGKSADCRARIHRLNSSAHPKEQGLPDRCFLSTRKYGLSTAAGLFQIVYYRNWRHLRSALNLKDFSRKSQAKAALELIRTSAVPGGKVGEGFRALLNHDLSMAVRKGTDPWASSPYSRWHGAHPAPYLQYLSHERAELAKHQNFRRQPSQFRHESEAGTYLTE